MAKCTACGNELPVDASFCPQCGRAAAQPVAAVVQPTATVAAGVGISTISDVQTIAGAGVTGGTAFALAPGRQFHGRYTIARQLGAGAMGVVYAARDETTGRDVAIKIINPVLADRPTARERFLREGLMARDIRHSNVVAMYDVGESEGQVYLVMEYLQGETLRKWLRRMLQEGRDVSFDTARDVIKKVLEGLAAAHATGVVHRDLKPENVMLNGDPEHAGYGLKILDFGIARAVGAASHVTTTSASTGTPLYMAPEQKTAADTVGPPADIYAVTAMLYELLIGVAPEGSGARPSRERRDLPPGIDAVIETGLAQRSRNRYQTAEEFVKALDSVGTVDRQVPTQPESSVISITGAGAVLQQTTQKDTSDIARKTSLSSLLRQSYGWKLWNGMSRKQRYVVGTLTVIVLLGIVGNMMPKEGQQSGLTPGASATDMNIAGRWFDEVTGTGVAQGYVDLVQQGNRVSGAYFDQFGNRAGTLDGQVNGTNLDYNWATTGLSGVAHGTLNADRVHIELDTQDHATGTTRRHTLHRNHLPPQ